MQQSAALLMEKSMPMGVGKLKDMNISRCGETGVGNCDVDMLEACEVAYVDT